MFKVTANYEVDSFSATKALVLSNLGAYGGRNIFLGQAYTTVGALCLVVGVGLLTKHFLPEILEFVGRGRGGGNSR